MMATVVPRMAWLADVLGVEGLALAAGAARGQYDVAAGKGADVGRRGRCGWAGQAPVAGVGHTRSGGSRLILGRRCRG